MVFSAIEKLSVQSRSLFIVLLHQMFHPMSPILRNPMGLRMNEPVASESGSAATASLRPPLTLAAAVALQGIHPNVISPVTSCELRLGVHNLTDGGYR